MKTIKLVNRNQVIKLHHSGRRGLAGTITIGTVTLGESDSELSIVNVGTPSEAILNFIIPKSDIVKSVNTQIGDVVLDTDDIADTATNRYTNDEDISRLADTSGVNTGDQDLTDLADEASVTSRLALKLNISDVVNNLTSSAADKPLSAAQGKALKQLVDALNQIVTSDDTSLDDLQEIVTYIKANKATLDNLSIGAVAGLTDALNLKADKSDTYTKAQTDSKDATVASTAQTNLTTHTSRTDNPHATTKAQVGLGSVPNTDFTSAVAANTAKISFDNTSSTRLANTSGTNTGDNATNTQYSGLATSKQDTLVSGTNIKTINSTSILGSGDIVIGGAVDSVNTQTGAVVLDTDDIAEGTNKYVTSAEKTILSNTSGVNTGDQDISGIATNASNITNKVSKAGDTMTGNLYIEGGDTTELIVGNAGATYNDYIQTFRAVKESKVEWLWGSRTAPDSFLALSLNLGNNYWDNKVRDFIMQSTAASNSLFVKASNGYVGIGTATPSERLTINGNASPSANVTNNLGSSSNYWLNTYTQKLYLNSTAYFDGGTAGQALLSGSLYIQSPSSSGYLAIDSASGNGTSTLEIMSHGASHDGDALSFQMRTDVANAIAYVYDASTTDFHDFFRFDYLNDRLRTPHTEPLADSTWDLGHTSRYWRNAYTDRLYLNSTAYLDGSTAGVAKLTGRLDIPVTTSTDGQITQGGSTILHTYTRGDGYFPNLYLGKDSGNYTSATTGSYYLGTGNLALGFQCLRSVTTGYYNIALGNAAGIYLTTGFNNFLAGHTAGNKLTTGSNNFLMGRNTGLELTTGSNNVGIGLDVLKVITTAGNNTAVGHTAGFSATGSANIFLGYQAGYNETGSNKLYIANSSTSTPLIGGDFSANTITTPASIEITDTAKGVILKSPNGTRWRVTIDNTGALTTASI